MTAWAMGAATRPPVCSLAPGWPSTITATAMLGGSPGRAGEADDPRVRLGAAPCRAGRCRSCRRPRCPAIGQPGGGAALHDADHGLRA